MYAVSPRTTKRRLRHLWKSGSLYFRDADPCFETDEKIMILR